MGHRKLARVRPSLRAGLGVGALVERIGCFQFARPAASERGPKPRFRGIFSCSGSSVTLPGRPSLRAGTGTAMPHSRTVDEICNRCEVRVRPDRVGPQPRRQWEGRHVGTAEHIQSLQARFQPIRRQLSLCRYSAQRIRRQRASRAIYLAGVYG